MRHALRAQAAAAKLGMALPCRGLLSDFTATTTRTEPNPAVGSGVTRLGGERRCRQREPGEEGNYSTSVGSSAIPQPAAGLGKLAGPFTCMVLWHSPSTALPERYPRSQNSKNWKAHSRETATHATPPSAVTSIPPDGSPGPRPSIRSHLKTSPWGRAPSSADPLGSGTLGNSSAPSSMETAPEPWRTRIPAARSFSAPLRSTEMCRPPEESFQHAKPWMPVTTGGRAPRSTCHIRARRPLVSPSGLDARQLLEVPRVGGDQRRAQPKGRSGNETVERSDAIGQVEAPVPSQSQRAVRFRDGDHLEVAQQPVQAQFLAATATASYQLEPGEDRHDQIVAVRVNSQPAHGRLIPVAQVDQDRRVEKGLSHGPRVSRSCDEGYRRKRRNP